jgi:hypothetical protein
MAGPVDNLGYELAAAGAELLLELELLPFDESELDELELDEESELDEPDEESEPDEEEDESEDDDEPVDSLLLADPLDEAPAALLAASRLSLR